MVIADVKGIVQRADALESKMYTDGTGLSPDDVDEQVQQIKALLPALDAPERATAHYAAAVFLACCEGTGETVEARIMAHAKEAVGLDKANAGAWRVLSHAYRCAICETGYPIPDTYTDRTGNTWIGEDLSPDDIEDLWIEIDRRQPLAKEAIRSAARAHRLDPEDHRNAVAVTLARDERLELYWLEDGIANAPFGIGRALLERVE